MLTKTQDTKFGCATQSYLQHFSLPDESHLQYYLWRHGAPYSDYGSVITTLHLYTCSIFISTGTIFWAHDELQEHLGNVAEIVVSVLDFLWSWLASSRPKKHMQSANRDELFKDLAPGGRYADITGIYHEHESHHKIGLPDRQMILALPQSVKWIAHKGAGYDQFDVGSCKARGSKLF
jgi:hypothetical protein